MRCVLAHLVIVPAGAEAGRVGIDYEGGDPFVSRIRLTSPGHDDEDIRVWCVRDVAFLTVDNVFVAVSAGTCGNAAGVRTGARFG